MNTGEQHAVAPSAADRAYRHIKDAVMSRHLPPFEVFSEGSIADAVGISRTPVREALLRLQSEGLVRLLPKRGAMVLPVTDEQRADLIETRRLVETFAVRKSIAGGRVAGLVTDLEAHLEAMRSAMKRRDANGYVEADRAFHDRIVAATGNSILIELYRSLRDRQLRVGVVNLLDESGSRLEPARMRNTITEHEKMLAAIAARSLRAAEAAVEEHLDHAARLLTLRASGS